jgi:hypothetical protein
MRAAAGDEGDRKSQASSSNSLNLIMEWDALAHLMWWVSVFDGEEDPR